MELALAEWGDISWADDVAKMQLWQAWLRRKRLESKILVGEIAQLLSAATGPKRVTPEGMLNRMGVTL